MAADRKQISTLRCAFGRAARLIGGGVALISGLLCVGFLALWVRSYFASDMVSVAWNPPPITGGPGVHHETMFMADSGSFTVCDQRVDVWLVQLHEPMIRFNRRTTRPNGYWTPSSTPQASKFLGFGRDVDQRRYGNLRGDAGTWRSVAVGAPAWVYVVVTGLPPLVWIVVAARRRLILARARHGRCSRCGYDLRASPERCPECGELRKSKHPAA